MERAIPILPAQDLAAAKSFYVDGLGFRVTFEASEDGRSGLLGIERGTIQMTLDSPMKGHGRNACERRKMRDGAHGRSICSTHPATPSLSWGRSAAQTRASEAQLRH